MVFIIGGDETVEVSGISGSGFCCEMSNFHVFIGTVVCVSFVVSMRLHSWQFFLFGAEVLFFPCCRTFCMLLAFMAFF
jgi:hypothetical protein